LSKPGGLAVSPLRRRTDIVSETLALHSLQDLVSPGAILPFDLLDEQGRLLLARGKALQGERQLEALADRGACALAEAVHAERAARERAGGGGGGGGADSGQAGSRQRTWFDRWEHHVWDIDTTLRRLEREPATARLDELVDQQIALVAAQPDAALFTLFRQDDRRFALYALTHARWTAAVVQLGAAQLSLDATQTRAAVAAALTMNASIVELQARMAEQRDPPTKRQLDQIRAHPTRSAEMLRQAGVDNAQWLQAVEEHHEQPGGGGYPGALAAPAELARLLRAADVFAAKVSPRAFRAPLAPQAAARQLFQEEKGSALAGALIKSVGVYPPGDLVRLKNGDIGVVARRADTGRGAEVLVLASGTGRPAAGQLRRDTGQEEFAIAGPLAERASLPRLLPEQVFGLLYA
jgi:hypothetical protein